MEIRCLQVNAGASPELTRIEPRSSWMCELDALGFLRGEGCEGDWLSKWGCFAFPHPICRCRVGARLWASGKLEVDNFQPFLFLLKDGNGASLVGLQCTVSSCLSAGRQSAGRLGPCPCDGWGSGSPEQPPCLEIGEGAFVGSSKMGAWPRSGCWHYAGCSLVVSAHGSQDGAGAWSARSASAKNRPVGGLA
jgi:hypothetical protein